MDDTEMRSVSPTSINNTQSYASVCYIKNLPQFKVGNV